MKEINDEEFENIMFGDEYKEITSERIDDQSRWNTYFSQVFQKISDGTYWEVYWCRGSTESQYTELEAKMQQVKPVEKTITTYEAV